LEIFLLFLQDKRKTLYIYKEKRFMENILKAGKKVAMCSDHAGYELKSVVEGYLESQGISYDDFGTHSEESCDYADFAHPCANAVESGVNYPGIAMCGSGNGIGITLNKHQGIRAALCWTPELARLARAHNDANVLVMPARFIDNVTALAIVDAFLSTPFDGGRHQRRIEKIPVK
jgi:ribose 5-phosphate isomerase B